MVISQDPPHSVLGLATLKMEAPFPVIPAGRTAQRNFCGLGLSSVAQDNASPPAVGDPPEPIEWERLPSSKHQRS